MNKPANIILEPGGTEATVGSFGARRYRKPLIKVRWCDVVVLLEESFTGWTKHNAPRLGAALAFYTLLSLMPFLLVVIAIAGLVFGAHAAQTGVMGQIQMFVGMQRAKIIEVLLDGAKNRADGVFATILGAVTLLFGASGVLTELRSALNTIWEVSSAQRNRVQEIMSLIRERLWSFALVLIIGLLLTISLLLSTWISAIGTFYASVVPGHIAILHVLNAVFSFIVITGLFGAIYKVVPDVAIEWRDVILGAAVTSLLFTLGNFVLGLYLGKASFSSTYGAAASTIVLALWVYYSSQVFFLGAEFTKAFSERYGSDPAKISLAEPAQNDAPAIIGNPPEESRTVVTP